MNKRHFEKCVSKEEMIYESNVKKYKTLMEMECAHSSECLKEIESVPIVTTEAAASTYVGIRELMQQLVEGQKQITTRLEQIELNQATLSQGQATLNSNQLEIANKLELIEASVASKPEMKAQSKLLIECKVAIRRAQHSLSRITGETCDKSIDEVTSMFPLRTIEAVQEVEEKLGSSDFTQAMNSYVHQIKGVSEEVGSVIRVIFTDDVLEKYNWDGRWQKLSLAKLMLFKIVRDVFQNQSDFDFEKSIKKAVERAHHRVKQKKYMDKINQNPLEI